MLSVKQMEQQNEHFKQLRPNEWIVPWSDADLVFGEFLEFVKSLDVSNQMVQARFIDVVTVSEFITSAYQYITLDDNTVPAFDERVKLVYGILQKWCAEEMFTRRMTTKQRRRVKELMKPSEITT